MTREKEFSIACAPEKAKDYYPEWIWQILNFAVSHEMSRTVAPKLLSFYGDSWGYC